MPSFPVLPTLILLLLLPAAAHADSFRASPLKTAPKVSLQAYARQNPRCAEWTDGCAICVAADGRGHCSTPGIACTPAGVTCKRVLAP